MNECAISRLWAGVNFKAAIEEGKRLCKPIGDIVYDFAMEHVNYELISIKIMIVTFYLVCSKDLI